VSKLFLKEHPLCECDECQKHHKLTSANVVHHIIAHHGNQELFWDESNWMAMNKKCHDKHTWIETRSKKQGDGV
jgi:5-methylcytosine-specific restriction protein A